MTHDALVRRLGGLISLSSSMEREIRSTPLTRVQIPRHRDLLKQFALQNYLYIVLSGWAARYSLRSDGSRRITGFMLPGDLCGIHAVAGAAMDHSIVALTDCEIGKVATADLQNLVASASGIGKALWRAKLVDEAILRQWLLASADTLQAVARLFCELHARLDIAGLCRDGACEVPLTQEQIGDATGRTGVHINRTVKRLRASGQLTFDHGVLRILMPAELRSLAQFDPRHLAPWEASEQQRGRALAGR